MDIEIFHFQQEFGDITVIFDKAHLGKGFFGLEGWAESLHCLFCKDMSELIAFLFSET